MSDTPRNNASVRTGPDLKRHDPSVVAEDNRRALADPVIQAQLDQMRETIVHQIETTPPDGTPESIEVELELCRTLRTLKRMRSGMVVISQIDELRAAGYRSKAPEPETEGQQ